MGTREGRETLGFLDRSIQVRLLLSLHGVEPKTNQRPSLPIVQVSATRPPPLLMHHQTSNLHITPCVAPLTTDGLRMSWSFTVN